MRRRIAELAREILENYRAAWQDLEGLTQDHRGALVGKLTLAGLADSRDDWEREKYLAAKELVCYIEDGLRLAVAKCWTLSDKLAELGRFVAAEFPSLWPECGFVGGRTDWHQVEGFDWVGGEKELRTIEAAALGKPEEGATASEQEAAYSVEASVVLGEIVPDAKRRRGWCEKQGIRCESKGKRLLLHEADWQRYAASNRSPAAPSTDEATPSVQEVAEMTMRLLEVKASTGRTRRLSDAE